MRSALIFLALPAAAACSSGTATGVVPLVPSCVDQGSSAPSGGWICGQAKTAECNTQRGAAIDFIFVPLDAQPGQSCATTTLEVDDQGPFAVGDHTIVVSRTEGPAPVELCTSRLTVIDTRPPIGTAHETHLWPPNHKTHRITTADCVTLEDACDPQVEVNFTYVASDEPVNAIGDGNTEPDVIIACDAIDIRSERQGPENGRVYTLGWRAVDHAGNAAEGTCRVDVVHDQSGRPAVQGAEAYRVDAPAACRAGGSNPTPP